jgi:hypothetical protein
VTLPDGEPIPFVGWVKEMTEEAILISINSAKGVGYVEGMRAVKNQKWQYLTDDEIKEIIGGYGSEGSIGAYTRSLIDKIEARIREKNEREPKENN